MLAVVGLGQRLFRGGEFGGELCAVGAFGSPCGDYGYGESCGNEEFSNADGEFPGHLVWLSGTTFASIVGLRRYLYIIYRRYLRRTETLRGSGSTSECPCYSDHR